VSSDIYNVLQTYRLQTAAMDPQKLRKILLSTQMQLGNTWQDWQVTGSRKVFAVLCNCRSSALLTFSTRSVSHLNTHLIVLHCLAHS
jgi:hypothetical protein